jgi:hypothetical protein
MDFVWLLGSWVERPSKTVSSVPSRSLIATHAKYVHLNADHSPIAHIWFITYAMTLLLCRLLQILWNSASNHYMVTSIKSRMNHPIMSVYKHYDQYSNTSILIYISLTTKIISTNDFSKLIPSCRHVFITFISYFIW